MLLFQETPHIVLPFIDTHMNLHLGIMIRNMNYGVLATFHEFMKKNANQKLVPIQGDPRGSSVQRKISVKVLHHF